MRTLLVLLHLPLFVLAQTDQPATLSRLIANNPVFNQGYTGFCLYDPVAGEYLFEYRADQRFTPASNVKLLTFLLSKELLDTAAVPALWFEDYGERLEVWGTGLPLENLLFEPVMEAAGKGLVVHLPVGSVRYGSGWSYDDWNDGFVFERSSLPVFNNRLRISLDSLGELAFEPDLLRRNVQLLTRPEGPRLLREEARNQFTLDTSRRFRPNFEREISLRMSRGMSLGLWRNVWRNDLRVGERPLPPGGPGLYLIRRPLPDSIFSHTLQESDNFWAEQLLLLCAAERQGNLDTEALLSYVSDTLWKDWGEPTEIEWVDGSGLSRYNQLSPRHLVLVIDRLRARLGLEALKEYLPANGINGTLENRFTNGRPPYIWAKTGSLRHVLALSGVLRTRSGKHLVFSFLHNHTQAGSRVYYREMGKVFEYLYRNY